MDTFVGRRHYLDLLEESFSDPGVKGVALIGRKHIGKSALIEEFVRGKESIVFQFINTDDVFNLEYASSVMSEYYGREVIYDDFSSLFADLEKEVSGRKMVLALDEYPFICGDGIAVSSMVQHLVDCGIGESMVILSGSFVDFMEREVSDNDGPLFGRFLKVNLPEMTFEECRGFHPGMSDEEMLKLFLTVGGIPRYHMQEGVADYRDYICRYFLSNHGLFADEGENIINRLPPFFRCGFRAILDNIPPGGICIPELRGSIGMDKSTCARYLHQMEKLGWVSRVTPMAGTPARPFRIRISDPIIAFTFQVLRKKRVISNDPYASFDRMSEYIYTFLGSRFEAFCSDYILSRYTTSSIGKWWWKVSIMEEDGKMHSEVREIDIVAEVTDGKNDCVLFAECKFRNRQVGYDVLEGLDESIRFIHNKRNYRRMLFSRSGFKDSLLDCESSDLVLVDLETLLGTGKRQYSRPISL